MDLVIGRAYCRQGGVHRCTQIELTVGTQMYTDRAYGRQGVVHSTVGKA